MQQPTPSPNYSNDEIDLRELAHTLWASKWLILLITFVVTAGAAAYAYLTPPTYQVQVDIVPPHIQSLNNYNMAYELSGPAMGAITNGAVASEIVALTPATALQAVYTTAASVEFRQSFQELLNTSLPTVSSVAEGPGSAKVSMVWQGQDPKAIAQGANRYATLALASAKDQLLNNLDSTIARYQVSIKQQIATLREGEKINLNNEITQLQEALALAVAIGLERPSDSGGLITLHIGEMAYLRGAQALRADIALRQARTNLDPYINELPNILKKQALLSSIQVDPNQLTVGLMAQTTPPVAQQIKPKKQLIIALGIVLGGMLGVFLVLIRHALRRPSA
ncbi:LPS O-antigen chain length determinant protein WzzB [Alcaligenaceae bacterium]|nr:LPS O-antigen chain length determinant protein WzzB [Alcaligenaceae bacterium]